MHQIEHILNILHQFGTDNSISSYTTFLKILILSTETSTLCKDTRLCRILVGFYFLN